MWKVLSQTTRSYRSLKIVNCSNLPRQSSQILRQNLLVSKRLQSTTPNQQNQTLKTPLNTSGPTPTQPKQDNSFKKLLVVFTSGALAYFTISYYLENRKGNGNRFEINYESNNLPGKVKTSKSVR